MRTVEIGAYFNKFIARLNAFYSVHSAPQMESRLNSLPLDVRTEATELLSRLPAGDREEHLEAFEMQQNRLLCRDLVPALAVYVKANGGGEPGNRKLPVPTVAPRASEVGRSSFAAAAAPRAIVTEKPIKTFNEALPTQPGVLSDKRATDISVFSVVQEGYRCMDLSVAKRAVNLARRTESIGVELMKDMFAIDEGLIPGKIGSGGAAQDLAVIGRVVNEENETPLSVHSILIEGDVTRSLGRRAKLYVSECNGDYALFPGQVIGCVGRTLRGGEEFVATRVLSGLSLPETPTVIPHAIDSRPRYAEGPAHLTIASGPFTPKDVLNFQVLSDFAKYVSDYKPHCLVLLGPFLDAGNSAVASGCVFGPKGEPLAFEQVYDLEILPRLLLFTQSDLKEQDMVVV